MARPAVDVDELRRDLVPIVGERRLSMREVDLRNAMFLMQALRRTQHMMQPAHYLKEYDLTSPAESVASRGGRQMIQVGRG